MPFFTLLAPSRSGRGRGYPTRQSLGLSPRSCARSCWMPGWFGLRGSCEVVCASLGMGLRFVVRKIDVEVASCWQCSRARTIWNDECFVQKITGAGCCAAVCKWLCCFFQHHLCSDSQICDQKAERTEGPVDAAPCSPSETCLFPPLSRSVPLTIKGDMEWNHVHLSMESAVLLRCYLLV